MEKLDQAYVHFEEGRFEEAELCLLDALGAPADDVTHAEAGLLLALVLKEGDRAEEAAEQLAAALSLAVGPEAVGQALFDEGLAWAAEIAFREAVRREPEAIALRVAVGDSVLVQGRVEAAIAEFEAAIAVDTRHPLPRERLVQALLAAGDSQRAAGQLSVLLQADPHNVPVLLLLGDLAFFQEAYREAIQHYREAIALEPQPIEVYENLAGACFIIDDLKGAVAAYEACVRSYPDYWAGYLAAGQLSEHLGWISRARSFYLSLVYVPERRAEALAALERLAGREDTPGVSRPGSRGLRAISERLRESSVLAAQHAADAGAEPEPELPQPAARQGPAAKVHRARGTGRLPSSSSRLGLPGTRPLGGEPSP